MQINAISLQVGRMILSENRNFRDMLRSLRPLRFGL